MNDRKALVMLLLLTAIIRGALLVLAGIAEQKGWFTPTQFDPYVNEIVNVIVTGLVMAVPIAWHQLEAADQKQKHLDAGFAKGVNAVDPTDLVGEVAKLTTPAIQSVFTPTAPDKIDK